MAPVNVYVSPEKIIKSWLTHSHISECRLCLGCSKSNRGDGGECARHEAEEAGARQQGEEAADPAQPEVPVRGSPRHRKWIPPGGRLGKPQRDGRRQGRGLA